jgi:hypothetical protein
MSHDPAKRYKSGAQVAALCGCSKDYILLRTNKPGGIKGTKIGGRWIYAVVDILHFYERYRPFSHEKPPLPVDMV